MSGGDTSLPLLTKGGIAMTITDLFTFCLVIIGIIGLFLQIYYNKKK